MTYTETREYLQQAGTVFCKPGTKRVAHLCDELGHPEQHISAVHVTGTNGKGSFCAMLASVLRKAGYRVGVFSSPAVFIYNESIRINDHPISDEMLAKIITHLRTIADKMADTPSEFELLSAAAYYYFDQEKVDIAIVETGMGARQDATNVLTCPLLSVITGVSLEHTAYLGDTIEKIAYEKAGVIKEGRPVLFGGKDARALAVIQRHADENGARLFLSAPDELCRQRCTLYGSLFSYRTYKDIRISLLGVHQVRNAALVLDAVEILKSEGICLPLSAVREGLYHAAWQARFEILSHDPLIIFDGAHNPEGIECAVQSIRTYFGDQKIILFSGILKDKDVSRVAALLSSVTANAYLVTPPGARGLDASLYAAAFEKAGGNATAYSSLKEALWAAVQKAKKESKPLLCLGSLYLYAQVRQALSEK